MKAKSLITLLLLQLLGMYTLQAQGQEWEGKILSIGESVTTLQTDKWYVLYNSSTSSYAKEEAENTLVATTTDPNGLDASTGAAYLVQLEAAGTQNKYYLKTGLGNYYANVTSSNPNVTSATLASKYAYTIAKFNTEGHWCLKNSSSSYFLQSKNGGLYGAASRGNTNGDCDWAFREVTVTSMSDLSGKDYVNFILASKNIVRFTNRRNTNVRLADDGKVGNVSPLRTYRTPQCRSIPPALRPECCRCRRHLGSCVPSVASVTLSGCRAVACVVGNTIGRTIL